MSNCPVCDAVLDSVTDITNKNERGPRPGDYSICFYCGTILQFDDKLVLRLVVVSMIPEPERSIMLKLQKDLPPTGRCLNCGRVIDIPKMDAKTLEDHAVLICSGCNFAHRFNSTKGLVKPKRTELLGIVYQYPTEAEGISKDQLSFIVKKTNLEDHRIFTWIKDDDSYETTVLYEGRKIKTLVTREYGEALDNHKKGVKIAATKIHEELKR